MTSQHDNGVSDKIIHIPWDQILNVTLTSESYLIVKFEVYSPHSNIDTEKSGELETLEFQILIGPCPAKR